MKCQRRTPPKLKFIVATPAAPVECRITTKARHLLIACKGCASKCLIRRSVCMCAHIHTDIWALIFGICLYLWCKHSYVGCQGFSVPISEHQVGKIQAVVALWISCSPWVTVNSKYSHKFASVRNLATDMKKVIHTTLHLSFMFRVLEQCLLSFYVTIFLLLKWELGIGQVFKVQKHWTT